MLNTLLLQGRLTTDPDFKNIKGNDMCQFTVASQRAKNKNGEYITDFLPVVSFGTKASFINRNFHKGDMIIINGRMQSRNFTDSNGNKRTAYECYVIDVYFCGSSAGHCTTKNEDPIDDDIDWDSIPDLPSEF